MALTTNTAYKSYAGITVTTWDTLLTTLIAAAQEAIERYCGRPAGGFETATWTQTRNGNGAESIFVPCWPVTSLTSVTEILGDGSTQALDSTTYRIGDRGEIARTNVTRARFAYDVWGGNFRENSMQADFGPVPQFVEGRQNFKVIYVGGYSSLPQSLVYACWRVVDAMFARRRQDGAITGESIEGYSYTKDADAAGSILTPEVQALLNDWRALA